MIFGVAVGIIIGALPGLSASMGLALMLPVTFGIDPITGMLLLLGVYCGGIYGGSITAILLKTPGTAASAATVEDGNYLARHGKASLALNMSIYASVAGGLISGLALLLFAPQIAKIALEFGPPEYFMIAIFGLTIIAGVSGKSLLKGVISGCIGMLIATIGMDPVTGTFRFTFNQIYLSSGISIISVLIGLFAISEVFNQLERRVKSVSVDSQFKHEKFGWKNMLPYKKTVSKSSLIGVIIGAIPGAGAAVSSFVSYSEAQRTSKDPDSFGKGNLHGVAASEAGNNGATGGTLIPTMSLGIPGDIASAVLLGGLLIQGLSPGPRLFTQNGEFVYAIIVGFIVVNIIMFIVAKLAVRMFARISTVKPSILFPCVASLCLVGAFAVSNAMPEVIIALIFGVIGYVLPKYGFPTIPILIAVILGPIAEQSLRQSLILSNNSLLIFVKNPISLIFFILTIVTILYPFIKKWITKRGNKKIESNQYSEGKMNSK
ncbi:C4-dicarboxylate ABC transporter permease [Virgibacillus dakarensis]|nr:C4-dicarboxylate ABC transporter permease [Virgibacillus dakarensis]